jgi:selenocysteine-specific elongation factor
MAFIEERRGAGLAIDTLARRVGVTPDHARAIAEKLAADGAVSMVAGEAFDATFLRRLEEKLVATVAAYHAAQPLSEGLPREEARERVFTLSPVALFDAVLKRLVQMGTLAGRERLALPGRGVSLTPEEARAQEALERVFREAGLAPPDLAGAASAAGVSAAVADRVTKLLVRQKTLLKVDSLLFHAASLERLKEEVRALKTGGGARVDVASFKERYGISRKYAIPLLEWLDRERITRRSGDARVVL